MWYYLVSFILSLFGIYLANRCYRQKFLFCIFSILALFPTIFLAGFRDHTIGSDTDFYILPIFYHATKYFIHFGDFVEANPNTDYLYLLYTWIVTRVVKDSYWFLFINHVLILVPMYIAAIKLRSYISPVTFFLIYYLVFYQDSLSIVRQSIAISFSMLAFVYFLSRKYKLYFILMLIAFGFHSTVIVTLIYPLLLRYLKKNPLDKNMKRYCFFVVLGIMVIVNLNFLLLFFINSGLLASKYLIYTGESDTFKGGLGLTNFLIKICIIYFIYSFRKKHKGFIFVDFGYVVSILDLMFCLFALLMEPLDRFSLYPRVMSCVTLPYIFAFSKTGGMSKFDCFKLFLICAIFAYWVYVYMLGDYGSTSNYKMITNII